VLRASQKEKLEFLDNNIKLSSHPASIMTLNIYRHFKNAISSKIIIEIDYKNTKEEVSRDRQNRLSCILCFLTGIWLPGAICAKIIAYFKVSRILKVNQPANLLKKQII